MESYNTNTVKIIKSSICRHSETNMRKSQTNEPNMLQASKALDKEC